MDVASWLRSLGLEQYEATFRDNAIDDNVLPDLTDQDLEKLGVLLGHRRKLLRAIANLQGTPRTEAGALGIWAARRCATSGHCRTPPSHGHVLRPCGLHGAFGAHGPGGFARGHFLLSEVRCRDRAALRWVRRELHGRRRPRVFSAIPKPVKMMPSG